MGWLTKNACMCVCIIQRLLYNYVSAVFRIYGAKNDIDFTSWFVMCCPIMLINLILAWLSLVFLFIGPR